MEFNECCAENAFKILEIVQRINEETRRECRRLLDIDNAKPPQPLSEKKYRELDEMSSGY